MVPVTAFVLVALVAAISVWVLTDAQAREASGRPVSVTIGSLTLDRPQTWARACLVASVVTLPLYLAARRAD